MDNQDSRFVLTPKGPFSLAPLGKLQCGFLRGTRSCDARGAVKVAFPRDGSFEIVGVCLTSDERRILGEVVGAHDGEAIGRQVARVLSVDHDAVPFVEVLGADPALARVAERRPGFRPPVSYSPYVMAAWSVLSQRIRMTQAAALQVRIAEAVGDVVEVAGDGVASFPRPQSLLRLSGFAGISDEKWQRLQAIARAALDGKLEADRLLAMPHDQAREELMQIRGVGPWTADGILMRGCGPVDILPLSERTLHGAIAKAYDLDHVPSDAEVVSIAERWRPFRMWVSVMLISEYFDEARQLVSVRPGVRPRNRNRCDNPG